MFRPKRASCIPIPFYCIFSHFSVPLPFNKVDSTFYGGQLFLITSIHINRIFIKIAVIYVDNLEHNVWKAKNHSLFWINLKKKRKFVDFLIETKRNGKKGVK